MWQARVVSFSETDTFFNFNFAKQYSYDTYFVKVTPDTQTSVQQCYFTVSNLEKTIKNKKWAEGNDEKLCSV